MNAKPESVVEASATRAKLLVVDDDPLIRKLLGRVLAARGYHISMAEDGEQAQDLLARAHFDLVLTDVRMPRRDGIALLRAIRDMDADLPVI